MSDKNPSAAPSAALVGKYLFFYTNLLPKEPQFISLMPAKVVSAKADRQINIEPAFPGDDLGKKFTRVGDHIAMVLNSLDDCKAFHTLLVQFNTQHSAMKDTLMAFKSVSAPPRVRVRTMA